MNEVNLQAVWWEKVRLHDGWVLVTLTWAGFLVGVQFESFVAVTGERTWRADADLFTVVFPLNTQINGCKHKGHLFSVSIIFHAGINISLNLGSVLNPFTNPDYSSVLQFCCYCVISEQKDRCDPEAWGTATCPESARLKPQSNTDGDQTVLPVQVLPSSFRVCPGRQRQWYEPGELSQMCSQPCCDTTHKSTPAGAEHQQGHYHTSKVLVLLEHKWEELIGETEKTS